MKCFDISYVDKAASSLLAVVCISDKQMLETRLSNSRQLLISQEETLRAHDNERKTLKTRVVSADLHAREKESRLQALNVSWASLQYM